MSRVALISRHIVSIKARKPIYGIIFVEGEHIIDIIVVDEKIPTVALVEKYYDWNPIDLENYFISPGLIDINVRREWEDARHLTQAAIAGGVTLIVEESGIHNQGTTDKDLFCDVGQFATVSRADEVEDNFSGVFGFKAYLFPPSSSVKAVENLPALIQAVENTSLPLVIDVIKPTQRLFVETSPCHFMSLEDRLLAIQISDSKIFAGAFPDEAQESGDEEESEIIAKPERSMSSIYEATNIESPPQVKNFLEMVEEEDNSEVKGRDRHLSISVGARKVKRRSSVHNIFSDLDKRIRVSEQSIENLSKVEQHTYAKSGSTFFSLDDPPSRPKSNSFGNKSNIVQSFSLDMIKSPEDSSVESSPVSATRSDRLRSRRPAPLKIEKADDRVTSTLDGSSLYMYYLANFPDQWEVSGVNTLVKAIDKSTCRVHVCCLSSASAINKIRRSQSSCNLSCEVAASCLYFTDSDIARGDTRFKNSPPIRNRSNFNLLWDLLKMKGIHSLTSQHRGILPQYKLGVGGSLKRALNGLNTIGYALQQIWSKLRLPCSSQEDLEHYIVRLAKWLSLHPAKVLGIDKQRGSIERGKSADFVIWDPHEIFTVKKTFSQFSELSPLVGVDLFGRIHKVMLRGKFVYSNSRFTKYGRRVFKTDS